MVLQSSKWVEYCEGKRESSLAIDDEAKLRVWEFVACSRWRAGAQLLGTRAGTKAKGSRCGFEACCEGRLGETLVPVP